MESRPAEAYEVDASSLDPGEEKTQGLVALVKGKMERMASLPFDGSRRGIHFEGSMQLESCCTGASLAAGDGLRQPAGAEESISIRYACIKSQPQGPVLGGPLYSQKEEGATQKVTLRRLVVPVRSFP